MLLGGIEFSQNTVAYVVGDEFGNIVAEEKSVLFTSELILDQIYGFFENFQIKALGISLSDRDGILSGQSKEYPIEHKPQGWERRIIEKMDQLEIPIRFVKHVDSDALGEFYYGAARNLTGCLYIGWTDNNIETSLIENNQLNHSVHSPDIEMGHILLRRLHDDYFKSICPYHQNCFQGLASPAAFQRRCEGSPEELIDYHQAQRFEIEYFTQTLMQYILVLSPEIIIIGGELFRTPKMIQQIRMRLNVLLGNYAFLRNKYLPNHAVTLNELGDKAAIRGTLALASLTVRATDIDDLCIHKFN